MPRLSGLIPPAPAIHPVARGFSLIELLIVLAVLAVLVGLALPRLDSAAFRADANVRLVRTALQHAQKLSLKEQHDVIVSFDIPGGRMRVAEDADSSHSVSPGEPVFWRALTEGAHFVVPVAGIKGAASSEVSGSALVTIDGMPSMTFFRTGSTSSSLEVYLQVKGRRAEAVRGVTLAQSTGRTEWFKRVGAAWRLVGIW